MKCDNKNCSMDIEDNGRPVNLCVKCSQILSDNRIGRRK